MSDASLASLARAAGISTKWTDAHGIPKQVGTEALHALLQSLGLPALGEQQIQASLAEQQERLRRAAAGPLLAMVADQAVTLAGRFAPGTPYKLILDDERRLHRRLDHNACITGISQCGYHQLLIEDQLLTLAVAPPTCQSVADLCGRPGARVWGLSTQLYSLRRPGDCGLGDTVALEQLARQAGKLGADALAISPVHAMFSASSDQYSPYSPSSRLFFNPLYAAPSRVLGEDAVKHAVNECGLEDELARLETLAFVDWPAASAAKQKVLRCLYRHFSFKSNELTQDFDRFCRKGGIALEQHCRFEALHAYMLQHQQTPNWQQWPKPFRDPNSTAVAQFAIEHAADVSFHMFCQWLINCGLERAQSVARNSGMAIGLISDLAVGADGSGSLAWSRQSELLSAITVGAPPDIINTQGQSWGVSAFSPWGLQEGGFSAFKDMLRANMTHAGGIRIDHVMGLKRLWVIPEGASPDMGAYLNYPFATLMHLVALESWRHQAIVIGEDLGTVPRGMRGELAERGALGMRVLHFEKNAEGFIPPEKWPDDALATTTTHDLPTILGWIAGRDIEWREKAGHRGAQETQSDRETRETERAELKTALRQAGELRCDQEEAVEQLDACIGFLGKTPAPLVLLPLEDALGELEQPNLPGPGNIHPNWRRRFTVNADYLLNNASVQGRLQRLSEARATRERESS
ncbi:4-alpha-glucanotransferase [Halopseudomonas salina]|uniref:4-alpha-glucanotransferase n=1 Tax=Halopseudomonas salina TaxID=1323744 RepID=A0ABQ1P0T1_9GAMM|nr:4-alpha-glucanotransferase [Halopseudomonas salina]GGC86794.1 4-alpha-glucanotransferase [Halopseudomonas salina]